MHADELKAAVEEFDPTVKHWSEGWAADDKSFRSGCPQPLTIALPNLELNAALPS